MNRIIGIDHKCEWCGTAITANQRYCQNCGHEQIYTYPNEKCPQFAARRGGQDGTDTYWECDEYKKEVEPDECNLECLGYLRLIKPPTDKKLKEVPIQSSIFNQITRRK